MKRGRIVKLVYGRGFGFIHTASHLDLFFHRSALDGVDVDALREGEVVAFEEGRDPGRNSLYATHVQLLESYSVAAAPLENRHQHLLPRELRQGKRDAAGGAKCGAKRFPDCVRNPTQAHHYANVE